MTLTKAEWFSYLTAVTAEMPTATEARADEAARFPVRGTPTTRLAQLALEALDGDDPEMVRICLRRLIELGEKT